MEPRNKCPSPSSRGWSSPYVDSDDDIYFDDIPDHAQQIQSMLRGRKTQQWHSPMKSSNDSPYLSSKKHERLSRQWKTPRMLNFTIQEDNETPSEEAKNEATCSTPMALRNYNVITRSSMKKKNSGFSAGKRLSAIKQATNNSSHFDVSLASIQENVENAQDILKLDSSKADGLSIAENSFAISSHDVTQGIEMCDSSMAVDHSTIEKPDIQEIVETELPYQIHEKRCSAESACDANKAQLTPMAFRNSDVVTRSSLKKKNSGFSGRKILSATKQVTDNSSHSDVSLASIQENAENTQDIVKLDTSKADGLCKAENSFAISSHDVTQGIEMCDSSMAVDHSIIEKPDIQENSQDTVKLNTSKADGPCKAENSFAISSHDVTQGIEMFNSSMAVDHYIIEKSEIQEIVETELPDQIHEKQCSAESACDANKSQLTQLQNTENALSFIGGENGFNTEQCLKTLMTSYEEECSTAEQLNYSHTTSITGQSSDVVEQQNNSIATKLEISIGSSVEEKELVACHEQMQLVDSENTTLVVQETLKALLDLVEIEQETSIVNENTEEASKLLDYRNLSCVSINVTENTVESVEEVAFESIPEPNISSNAEFSLIVATPGKTNGLKRKSIATPVRANNLDLSYFTRTRTAKKRKLDSPTTLGKTSKKQVDITVFDTTMALDYPIIEKQDIQEIVETYSPQENSQDILKFDTSKADGLCKAENSFAISSSHDVTQGIEMCTSITVDHSIIEKQDIQEIVETDLPDQIHEKQCSAESACDANKLQLTHLQNTENSGPSIDGENSFDTDECLKTMMTSYEEECPTAEQLNYSVATESILSFVRDTFYNNATAAVSDISRDAIEQPNTSIATECDVRSIVWGTDDKENVTSGVTSLRSVDAMPVVQETSEADLDSLNTKHNTPMIADDNADLKVVSKLAENSQLFSASLLEFEAAEKAVESIEENAVESVQDQNITSNAEIPLTVKTPVKANALKRKSVATPVQAIDLDLSYFTRTRTAKKRKLDSPATLVKTAKKLVDITVLETQRMSLGLLSPSALTNSVDRLSFAYDTDQPNNSANSTNSLELLPPNLMDYTIAASSDRHQLVATPLLSENELAAGPGNLMDFTIAQFGNEPDKQ